MIRIVRIEGKAEQGQTEPLVCVGADGVRYVVKGQHAGRLSLIREWIGATLGRELGLPIPQFELLELDQTLLEYDSTSYAALIGRIPAFGSRRVEAACELSFSQLETIHPDLRAQVLLFDWWIANGDRTLSPAGGNPNLLWDMESKALVVIDHNLAFDQALCTDFWTEHIFREDVRSWTADFRKREEPKLRRALASLDKIWCELPGEWTEVDCGISLPMVQDLLWRLETAADTFWRTS